MKPDEELMTTKEVVDRIKWLQNQASIGWSNATVLHLSGKNTDELCGAVEAYEARIEALLGRLVLPEELDMSKCTTCGDAATEWPGGVPRCYLHV